jgi:signal transduction histidine kinase
MQILLISASAAVGVYLAEFAIRELLIVSALEREADYFWARQNIDADTPTPNTYTLIGYIFDADRIDTFPEEFQGLAPGIHDLTTQFGQSVVLVSDTRGRRLFLVFDADNVRQLATYFGLVPLTLLLIVLYSSALLAYRIAGRAVSPVIKLARRVRELDFDTQDRLALANPDDLHGADDEIISLSQALEQLIDRLNNFVDRERILTREASHELRSPLTVIKIASEMLLTRNELSEPDRAMADKIHRAANDMVELTEAFLLLAREADSGFASERLCLNDVVAAEIIRCEMVYKQKANDLILHATGRVWVLASPTVVGTVVGNLIRNACAYTDHGRVVVTISSGQIKIEDSGVGISDDQLEAVFSAYYRAPDARESGHGIGLSIVKRMTDRYDWPLEISSERGHGTVITVRFPESDFEITT